MDHLSPDDLTGASRVMHDGHKPTEEQQAIFDALENSRDHLFIQARAGSGKTSTVVECVGRLDEHVHPDTLFLAFNKGIQAELDTKLPEPVWNKTMHSYGLGLIAQEIGWDSVNVDDRREKAREIVNDVLPKQATKKVGRGPIYRLTDLCKATLTDEEEYIRRLVQRYRMGPDLAPFTERIIKEAPVILDRMADNWELISYSDMTWFPIRHDLWTFPKDIVFVDEAQDLNRVNHELLMRLLSRGGRCIAVGDKKQSLYNFRGAHPNSMPELRERLHDRTSRGVTELPLTVTFRCPTHVVDLAQQIVPDFEAFREDPGVVRHADPLDGIDEVDVGDLVLCGKNAPLIRAAYRFVAKKKPAMVRGRDIGKGLTYTTERVAGKKDKRTNTGLDSEAFMEKLRTWRDRQLKDLDEDDEDGRAKVMDRFRCLKLIARESENVGEMLDFIDEVFPDVHDEKVDWDNLIQLSTVHKIKGKESDRVFILSPYEDLAFGQQGANIAYVAVTRAKEELVFLGDLPSVFGLGLRWTPPEERREERREESGGAPFPSGWQATLPEDERPMMPPEEERP